MTHPAPEPLLPGRRAVLVRRLERALAAQGAGTVSSGTLEEAVEQWAAQGGSSTALQAALRGLFPAGKGGPLPHVAWGMLGVPAPGSVALGAAREARLTHLAELHDVTGPAVVEGLGTRLSGEPHLVTDLLRARPWLMEAQTGGATAMLGAVFRSEWAGFLVLLGEFGPWAYVSSVADLQRLSRHYRGLVEAASRCPPGQALEAALRLTLQAPDLPLLVRLEVTDYRSGTRPRKAAAQAAPHLARLEEAFWAAARGQAQRRRDEWAASRRGG
ncbi:hypothetical protein [Deinococcus hopiensis]|uniref:Uncharacterized protein n=1 Tax=Deinococcus hopiensis KR-140 TaxID=695939 RepID=A0A1W1UFM5_9DEIO|nr:hypothetical protein [Deinococcus hopiensis]SMB79870.1 hypothetical protein SAMN00790413_05348 [Deinococcus hopiensis KR-140]